MIDLACSRTVAEIRRVLAPKGVLVAVGGPIRGMWLSPVTGPLSLVLRSLSVSQSLKPFLTRKSRDDLAVLRELMENGKSPRS